MQARGIKVEDVVTNSKHKRSDRTIKTEYDIIAVNGKEIVVIEVKTTLNSDDVDKFLNKLKFFKKYYPLYENKTVYGGIAYLGKADGDSPVVYAQKSGLFTFQAPGGENSVTIIVNDKDFKPKAF